jgi:hypothetical protein
VKDRRVHLVDPSQPRRLDLVRDFDSRQVPEGIAPAQADAPGVDVELPEVDV